MTMHLASLWNRGLGQFGNGLLKSWLYCLLAMTKLLRKLGPNSSPKTVLQCTSTQHLQATPRPLHSNQGWSNAKAQTLHFPILDLRGGVGAGHEFPIYFVQDCSKLFSSIASKLPISEIWKSFNDFIARRIGNFLCLNKQCLMLTRTGLQSVILQRSINYQRP